MRISKRKRCLQNAIGHLLLNAEHCVEAARPMALVLLSRSEAE